MKKVRYIQKSAVYYFITFLLLASCQKEETTVSSFGKLSITIPDNLKTNNGRMTEEEIPHTVAVSINTSAGVSVLNKAVLPVTEINGVYYVDPVSLEIGDYDLAEFLVFNDSGKVVYATPASGSTYAPLVAQPLPVRFGILTDFVTEQPLEVITTAEISDPEDIGYGNLSFGIVPTIDILVSVFDTRDTGFVLSEATLTVHADSTTFTQLLGDTINVVRLREDYSQVEFIATLDDGRSDTIVVDGGDLPLYVSTPLDFIIPPISKFTTGLYALIGNNIASIDVATGDAELLFPLTGITDPTIYIHQLAYDKRSNTFYVIQNQTDNPSLATINSDGQYQEIGSITYEGQQLSLVDAIAIDPQSGIFYISTDLEGDSYASESLMSLDPETAEATFLTEMIIPSVGRADMDNLSISDGVIHIYDGATNVFSKIFSIAMTNLNIDSSSSPNEILSRSNIPFRTASTGSTLYLGEIGGDKELRILDLNNPGSGLTSVGVMHSDSEFEGGTINGMTFIE